MDIHLEYENKNDGIDVVTVEDFIKTTINSKTAYIGGTVKTLEAQLYELVAMFSRLVEDGINRSAIRIDQFNKIVDNTDYKINKIEK
jgi:hypothetical protein